MWGESVDPKRVKSAGSTEAAGIEEVELEGLNPLPAFQTVEHPRPPSSLTGPVSITPIC
jgi:hypothetical protein